MRELFAVLDRLFFKLRALPAPDSNNSRSTQITPWSLSQVVLIEQIAFGSFAAAPDDLANNELDLTAMDGPVEERRSGCRRQHPFAAEPKSATPPPVLDRIGGEVYDKEKDFEFPGNGWQRKPALASPPDELFVSRGEIQGYPVKYAALQEYPTSTSRYAV